MSICLRVGEISLISVFIKTEIGGQSSEVGIPAVRLFPLNSFVLTSDPRSLTSGLWCERGDSNPHTFRYQILSLARLPIPPLSQIKHSEIENSIGVTCYRTGSGDDRIIFHLSFDNCHFGIWR